VSFGHLDSGRRDRFWGFWILFCDAVSLEFLALEDINVPEQSDLLQVSSRAWCMVELWSYGLWRTEAFACDADLFYRRIDAKQGRVHWGELLRLLERGELGKLKLR
jgi:hypothetical protein